MSKLTLKQQAKLATIMAQDTAQFNKRLQKRLLYGKLVALGILVTGLITLVNVAGI